MPLPDLGVPLRSRTVWTGEVWLHVVEAGPEDGPPVLLLHGFPEHWLGWRHQIPALARAGWRVVAPDGRGVNRSQAPAAVAAYDLDRLAADVVALQDDLGVAASPVVGHDWGALVAWWLAMRRPERVSRLAVLNVPHPGAFRRFAARHPSQLARSGYIAFFQLPLLPELALRALGTRALRATSAPGTFSDEDLARDRAAWRRPWRAFGPLAWYRALARRVASPAAEGRVAAPTLVLWGDADVALDARLAERSLAYCDAGRLVVLPGVSHWVQHEAADRVNAELVGFLGAPDAGPPR